MRCCEEQRAPTADIAMCHFVPGDAGGMIICDHCGHAAEVVEDDHNDS